MTGHICRHNIEVENYPCNDCYEYMIELEEAILMLTYESRHEEKGVYNSFHENVNLAKVCPILLKVHELNAKRCE